MIEWGHKVIDPLHVSASGVSNGPNIQNPLQALAVGETMIKNLPPRIEERRRLPVVSRPASIAASRGGSSARRFQSGAKFVDRALLFLAQTQVPPGRRTLLVFGRESGPASEVARVNGPGRI